MAKAGLFPPVEPAPAGDDDADGAPSHQRRRRRGASLAFFDAVLADIGDAQSLQQSLSTFSGHVRRLRRVLAAAGPASLVLLDEVGSGTDPGEGAALARAVLDALAARSALTLATTHHAELKGVAAADARYANASMGFDTASLAPTYALAWGAAGASNALDIAERLGFDAAVVGDARRLAASEEAARAAAAADMARVAASVERQLGELRARLARRREARAGREARVAALRGAERDLGALRATVRRGPALVAQVAARRVLALQLALAEFRRGGLDAAAVAAQLEELEALLPPKLRQQVVAGAGGGSGADAGSLLLDGAAVELRPGDRVAVPRLGAMGDGTVVSVAGDTVTVAVALPGLRGGSSKVKVAVDEVVRAEDVAEQRARLERQQRQQEGEGDGDGGGKQRRGSAYGDLLTRLDEALARLNDDAASSAAV